MRQKVEMDKKSHISVKMIIGVVVIVLLVLACLSVPNEESMRETMDADIKEAVAEVKMGESDSTKVTEADVEKDFLYYNILEYKKYGFFSVMNIIDRYSNESSVAMIGLYGMPMTIADLRPLVITDRPALPQKKQRPSESGFDTEPLYTGHDYDVGKFDDAGY